MPKQEINGKYRVFKHSQLDRYWLPQQQRNHNKYCLLRHLTVFFNDDTGIK